MLAYSGDVDTSAAIAWLIERRAEVIAVTLDIGQGRALERIRERALAAGALRAHVLDMRDEFVHEFVLRTLQAGAVQCDRAPLAGALAAPLMARKLLELAALEQVDIVAHGARRVEARIARSIRLLNPTVDVMAPAHQWGMSRAEAAAYAKLRGISIPLEGRSGFTVEQNLWARSIECIDADPGAELDNQYALTKSPQDAPREAAYVEIEFNGGVPIAVNDIPMPLTELIGNLETIGGVHGIGRSDVLTRNGAGAPRRTLSEAPAAAVLYAALDELERAVMTRDVRRLKHQLSVEYAELIDAGEWFTPKREAIDGFVSRVARDLTGTVRMRVFQGSCRAIRVATTAQRVAEEREALRGS